MTAEWPSAQGDAVEVKTIEGSLGAISLRMASTLELGDLLSEISQGLVQDLGAALARIWLIRPGDLCAGCAQAPHCPNQTTCLHLVASAGLSERLDGEYRRVPLGTLKIGRIAESRQPVQTNDLVADPRIRDKEWVRREGLRSFAGYPLEFRGELRGVLGVFARRELIEAEFERLGVFAAQAAVAIENARLFEEVSRRTAELTAANDDLRRQIAERQAAEHRLLQAQADLAHVNRVTTMGELTASLAHEVNQPIGATVANANACLRWLAGDQPNLAEARAAAARIVADGRRAAEIISGIRLLFKKGTPRRELIEVNEVIREIVVLLCSEAARWGVSVRTALAESLPRVAADRVQLQQVLMNLIVNAIDALKSVDGTREIAIESRPQDDYLLVSVSDTGAGLPLQQADRIFDAFFTTKDHGTGMGLAICRSIIESHEGRLWGANNSPRGAIFCFALPLKAEN